MRLTRASARVGAIAAAASALVAGALLTAPATQAVTPTETAVLASALAIQGPQGGDAVYRGGFYRCTLGFNVRNSSNVYYFLTSRSCGGNIGDVFYANSARTTVLGTTVALSPADKDYALVKYTAGITPSGAVDLYSGSYQDITSAANAYVGEPIKRSGSTTHVHSGTVTGVDVNVYFAEGNLTGMIKTNVCAEGGDSGGPLFDGAKALGLASRGSGNCTTGGTTYFQPIAEPLAVYGVSVY